jgi:prevent-host-death family protein
MTAAEHRMKIAEARNVLGEVIARARFADEPTVLMNRGKEAAVLVSVNQYEQAKQVAEALHRMEDAAGSGADLVLTLGDGTELVIEVKSFKHSG